jgi:hypothetical protein
MKEFKVGFYYTNSGGTIIKANSKQEAEEILNEQLAQNGIPKEWEPCDREWGTFNAEEIK